MVAITGKCLCGQITYKATKESVLTAICHCTDCQKWTGSHYTWNVIVPKDSFKVTKGSPSVFSIVGSSGKKHPHYFCGNCGSNIYSEPEALADLTVIKAGTINGDKADKLGIGKELFMKDRLSYLEPIKDAVQDPIMTG